MFDEVHTTLMSNIPKVFLIRYANGFGAQPSNEQPRP